jgi:hypothetical protein
MKLSDMNKSNTLWILATCVVVAGVIIYIVNGISNETSGSSSRNSSPADSSISYSSPDTYSSSNNNTENDYSSSNSYSEPEPIYEESQYKGNQLKNGSSPLDACFGKGIYKGNATLTIKNGSSTDAIVCLYSISRARTIRNEYVRKNSNFKMDNIAQGYYKIRVFYGNDWNPTLENSCGTKGNFESNISFSEFDGKQYFKDNNDSYTVATITLYTVEDGNVSTSKISQSDFFNN